MVLLLRKSADAATAAKKDLRYALRSARFVLRTYGVIVQRVDL